MDCIADTIVIKRTVRQQIHLGISDSVFGKGTSGWADANYFFQSVVRFSDRRKKLIARTQIGHQSERKCMGSTGDLWTDQRIFPAKTVCIYPL